MRGKRAKALRTLERPNPGRKHGGAEKDVVNRAARAQPKTSRYIGDRISEITQQLLYPDVCSPAPECPPLEEVELKDEEPT